MSVSKWRSNGILQDIVGLLLLVEVIQELASGERRRATVSELQETASGEARNNGAVIGLTSCQ